MKLKNSLNEDRHSFSIQMGKWRATDKKQNVSFHIRQAGSSQSLNQPLFLLVAEHFRIWIERESLHSLILAFLGLPVNFWPTNIEKIRLDIVWCIIKNIRLFLSQRCRFFRSGYPSDIIPSSYNYEFQQILGLKKQLRFSVKNQSFALFGFLY